MPTFGHPAQGTSVSAVLAADRKNALKAVAPEDGIVTALYADLQNLGTEIQAFRMGIYADAASMSSAPLLDSSDVVTLAPGATRSFQKFTGINAFVSAGSTYWIAFQNGPTGGNAQVWQDTGTGQNADALDSFVDGLSSTFGTAGISSNSLAVYADYVATTSVAPGLARVILGRKYSAGVGVA